MKPSRLCAIGNSHLAALRGAWDLGNQPPGLQATWFGAMRDGIARLRLVDGALRANTPDLADSLAWTSGGRREIVLGDYDAFLLVGLGLSFTSLARLYGANRTPAQSQELRVRRLVSSAVFDAATTGLVRDSLSLSLARIIRRVTPAPILVLADPLPGEIAAHGKEASLWTHLAANADGADLMRRFHNTAEKEASSAGAIFLPQPDATRAAPPFSHDRLRRGAVRMRATGDTPFEDEDPGHMGPEYGTHVLAAAAQLLAAGRAIQA